MIATKLACEAMTRYISILALAVMLACSAARADDLNLGGTFNQIEMNTGTVGGGSIVVSSLNGNTLAWVYCVDIIDDVYVPADYPNTIVRNDGIVNGSLVNNAGEVAWLLDNYAVAAEGNANQQIALQAAIWHVIYGNAEYLVNTAPQYSTYSADLTALGSNTDPLSDINWFSPKNTSDTVYQGLVGPTVPEPMSILLLATVLLCVARLLKQKLAIDR